MTDNIGQKVVVGITTAIRFVTLSISLAFWLIVGFIFWIPLLARTTATFCIGVLRTMLKPDTRAYVQRLRAPLEFAMSFYVEGFQRIFQTLYSADYLSTGDQSSVVDLLPRDFGWKKFIGEIIWTLVFWMLIFYGPQITSYAIKELPNRVTEVNQRVSDSSAVSTTTRAKKK